MNNGLRRGAQNAYEQLVKGTPYLILLISGTVSIVLSIIGSGIYGIFSQVFPLVILIGLYIARTANRTGVKMVQVCASILFWIYCVLCGLMLVYALILIAGGISVGNSVEAAIGGLVGLIIAGVVILLQFFFPILYYRDIKMILKDILGWFVSPGEDASSDFPPESRHRVSCKLVVLCIIQLVLNGISALYLLAMMTRTSITANISGMFLDGIIGGGSGSQIMGRLFLGSSIFSILAEAAIIVKFVCVILLYKQYLRAEVVPQQKPKKEPAPSPEQDQVPVAAPAPQPAPKKRSVRIVLERKSPKEGRFSASMTSEMIVGRKAGEAKLVITDDQAISSRHMRLVIRDNKLYAEDLGSHNGIYVNGRKVEKTQQIHRGDEIRLGNSVFVLKWET